MYRTIQSRPAISSELADCYECMGQCGITYVVVLAWTGARAKERQLRIYLCLLCDAALYLLILTLETLYRLLEGSLAWEREWLHTIIINATIFSFGMDTSLQTLVKKSSLSHSTCKCNGVQWLMLFLSVFLKHDLKPFLFSQEQSISIHDSLEPSRKKVFHILAYNFFGIKLYCIRY